MDQAEETFRFSNKEQYVEALVKLARADNLDEIEEEYESLAEEYLRFCEQKEDGE